MSEMIERVARALSKARFLNGGNEDDDGWDDLSEPLRADYLDAARAAIDAMRAPTAEMIEAEPEGDGEWDKTNSAACAKEFWQAMIDAALNEKSPATS